jgi:hypothetical protein
MCREFPPLPGAVPVVVGYARFLLGNDPGPPKLFSAAFPGTFFGGVLSRFGGEARHQRANDLRVAQAFRGARSR